MRILKNKEIKKLFVIDVIIIIISILSVIVINNIQNNKYKKDVNYTIMQMLETIKKEYPNVDDEELIKILNKKNIKRTDKNVLENYGIYENELSVKGLTKRENNMLIYNVIVVVIASISLIIVTYIYLKHRQNEIDKITEYVEDVSNKKYVLNIEENSEDELSRLKNELYKITVMLKEQAENSEDQKEALAMSVSDISHQLKTPLTSTLILLDNLSQSDKMDKSTREKFIAEIYRQIENMNWLVIVLLKLSRLDAEVVDFRNEDINANKLISEIVSNLEIMAELKNVHFVVKERKDCFFKGDYNWNKEAIQNIVKNAIEHTNTNTNVTITIEENSVYTSVSIKDEGHGISQKDLKHIFDRFYKSENSSEKSFGIGLSLSKTIIEKQKGYIEVYTKEKEGTTFKIKYIK